MAKQMVSQYDGTHVRVGNTYRRVDKGAAVPAGADQEHVDLLVERGMLAEGEPTAGFVDPGPGLPPFTTEDDDVDGDGPIPAKSANKADWVAYAVSLGVDQGVAASMTKEDLIESYGRPAD